MTAVLDALAALPPWLVLLLVFLLPMVEASLFVGLVVPGETAVLVGGVVAHSGALPLWAVIVGAVAGAAAGDQIGFLVGRRYGQRLLDRLPDRLTRSGDIERALSLLRRRGAFAVVIGRWAAALRALVPGLAGMSGMPQGRFTAANISGGAIWAMAVAVVGYAAGASLTVLAKRLGLAGEVLLAAAVVALVVGLFISRRRRTAQNQAPLDPMSHDGQTQSSSDE